MEIKEYEMLKITGGINISGTLLNAVAKLITTIFDIGKAIGSALRMATSGRKC